MFLADLISLNILIILKPLITEAVELRSIVDRKLVAIPILVPSTTMKSKTFH